MSERSVYRRMKCSAWRGLAFLACAGAFVSGVCAAQSTAEHPNFADTDKVGWIALSSEFIPPASGPGPVMDDPAHPYVSNAIAVRTRKLPTFPITT